LKTEKLLIIGVISLLGISINYFPEASAEDDYNLFVSARNSDFGDTFSGPMVIEVTIEDKKISSIDKMIQEPLVFVDGKILKMMHGIDGRWYGYFADKTMAEIADATTSVNGKGLDFGGICSLDSARKSIFNTDDPNLFRDVSAVAYNDPSCSDNFDKTNINVLKKAKQIVEKNLITSKHASIVSTDAWPFIQLYSFNEGPVEVKYVDATQHNEITKITFERPNPEKIYLKLEGKESYLPDSSVLLTLTDFQLNIDPTDEDSWTWETTAPGGLFYNAFTETGNLISNNALEIFDVLPHLSDLMFENDRQLILDPFDEDFPQVVTFSNNAIQKIDFTDSLLGSQPITFKESRANSGIFNNFDDKKNSNLVVSSDALDGSEAWLRYHGTWYGILISDKKMTWKEPEYSGNDTASLEIKNPFMNTDPDIENSFNVTISSRADQKGFLLLMEETAKDSGLFEGSVALYNQKDDSVGLKKDLKENQSTRKKLLVCNEDRVYATHSYINADGVETTNKAKSTVSEFNKKKNIFPIDDLFINFPKTSDYYFSTIERLEERMEAINFPVNGCNIEMNFTSNATTNEIKITQTIKIDIQNRTDYDQIFDTDPMSFLSETGPDLNEVNVKQRIDETFLEQCNKYNEYRKKPVDCNEEVKKPIPDNDTNTILSNILNKNGTHIVSESIFYNKIYSNDTDSQFVDLTKGSIKQTRHNQDDDTNLHFLKSKFSHLFPIDNKDLTGELVYIPKAHAADEENNFPREFLFLNGFSHGFQYGKIWKYDHGDVFSAEAHFAIGLALGLRIPMNVTATPINNNDQIVSYTVDTKDLEAGEYTKLGLDPWQDFEGQEFNVSFGPEVQFYAESFDRRFIEFEQEFPYKPESNDFKPDLGGEGAYFTDLDFGVCDLVPLCRGISFIDIDIYAGVDAYLKGNQVNLEVIPNINFRNNISENSSTLPKNYTITFTSNYQPKTAPYPASTSPFTIGNLTYDSTLHFVPIIGIQFSTKFLPFFQIYEEIELGNIEGPKLLLGPHVGTNSTYNFTVNVVPDNYCKIYLNVTGYEKPVCYTINNGLITSNGTTDNSTNSLIIPIDAKDDGQLTIELPRELIDAKIDDVDKDFLVLVNGKVVDFDETTSSVERTLVIPFTPDAKEIKIIGTNVIPEFGIMATMILGMALFSIIALTLKSKILTRF